MVVTFNLAGVFGTPIQTNIDHCGNYRQPSWRPVIDAQYGRTDAGAIYFLDRPGNTEVLGRAQVRVHGNSEATGIDGQPITLVATCRHGELSFELANLPPASGSFSVRSRIEADEWIDSAWRIITSESGWTFAPFEADYGRLRQSARVEFEIPLSPLVRVSFDLSALFSTPIQANIDNCGADPWPQMNSYVAIIQATGSVGERISYRAEPVFRADITSTPLVSTHLESWEKSELGQGGWVRLSVTCEGSNHLAVQLGNFEWDESNTSERVILEVGDHAPEASQWRVHIATKRKDKPGPYGYSLRSSDPERLVAQMRGASVVRIQIPSIGLGPVGFDIDGMFETPVQGNLDECGHYLSGETRRLRANAEACATRSGTVSEGTGKGEASYLAPSGWMAEATGLLAQAYRASAGVWSGFDPAEHQVVLAHRKSDGQVDELLTIGVFSPESLGKATPLSTAGTPFCTLVRVEELNEETLRVLNQIGTFAFQIAVGPRVSGLFVMSVDLNDDHYSPLADEVYGWSGFVMHELFHHYQDGAWAQSAALDQNFESYAYGADNLELAALEDRALRAAASAPDAKSRLEAVRHFSAVRLMRAQLIPAILHDEHQERVEGTARYLERQLDLGFAEDGSHLLRRELERVLADARLYGADRGVRAYYAFSRHYETGAAIIRLLRLFGVSNFASQIEAGKSPARVLAEYLGITQVDVERLVGEARAIYDPDGELPALAVRLAATAGKEDWVGP
ncbi:MAG: hypothetical protein F4Z38_09155 [Chloroflexi bacterium]|nr:hypothetical protein [Chloroflexota bacterium]